MRIAQQLEFRRQIMHLAVGLAFVILIYFNIINVYVVFFILILGLMLSLLSKKIKILFIYDLLKNFERPHQIKSFPGKGPLFMVLGIFLSLLFFHKDAAMASIMILALGDSLGHIVGRYCGRIKHPMSSVKMLEGSIVGTIAAFLGALLFVSAFEAFWASLIAMVFEAADMSAKKHILDDNLVIPLLSGAVISLIRLI